MKPMAGMLLLISVGVSPEPRYFHYQRAVEDVPAQAKQACLVLDAAVFAQAAPELADLRLYRNGSETPYVIHLAAPGVAGQGTIGLLNKGIRGKQTVFDAEMPEGHYSDLNIDVNGHDFIASVEVSGSQTKGGAGATKIGAYTIFDLTKQRLGRSTVLHLPESDFKYLHFRIPGPLSPDSITALSVARLPASQPQYVTVAQTAQVQRKGHGSAFELTVPANVPVDRVEFEAGSQPPMFSRDVTIKIETIEAAAAADSARSPETIAGGGNLLRLHTIEDGHRIDEERLTIVAPRSEFVKPTRWTITIDNGDDAPLEMQSVRLEMLERNLCFAASGSGSYVIDYGDAALPAPRYDYATLFVPQPDAAKVSAGPEQNNPAFEARPDERPFTERHPALLWAALIAVIGLLAAIALGSLKGKAGDP